MQSIPASETEALTAQRGALDESLVGRTFRGIGSIGRRIGPAVPFAVKAGAFAGAGAVLLYGSSKLVTSYGHRNDPPPLGQSTAVTGEGTLVRTPDGGLFYIPTGKYAKDLKDLGYNLGSDTTKGLVPVTLAQPESPGQRSVNQDVGTVTGALTSPLTLLIIGAVILGAIFLKK